MAENLWKVLKTAIAHMYSSATLLYIIRRTKKKHWTGQLM